MRIGIPVDSAPLAFWSLPPDAELDCKHQHGQDRHSNGKQHGVFMPGSAYEKPDQRQTGHPKPGISGVGEENSQFPGRTAILLQPDPLTDPLVQRH